MADRAPVRVALLNDHSLVVQGLAAMLEPYADRVQIRDVQVKAPPQAAVDVALFDTYDTALDEAHWSRLVGEGWSPTYVVAYCWQRNPQAADLPGPDDPPVIQVSKTLDGLALVEALEEIVDTGTYAAEAPEPSEETPSPERRWPGKAEGLSERESEVLALIVAGMSNVEVAAHVFLGVNTIKTYIRSAYRKIGVTSRTTAVLWGIDHGFRRERPSH